MQTKIGRDCNFSNQKCPQDSYTAPHALSERNCVKIKMHFRFDGPLPDILKDRGFILLTDCMVYFTGSFNYTTRNSHLFNSQFSQSFLIVSVVTEQLSKKFCSGSITFLSSLPMFSLMPPSRSYLTSDPEQDQALQT